MGILSDTREKMFAMPVATALFLMLSLPFAAAADTLPPRSEILSSMRLVNAYWIGGHPDPGDNLWARSTYFSGNMDLYGAWPGSDSRDYALLWAESHDWSLEGGTATRFADNHCAGQAYIALYEANPVPVRIAEVTESIFAMVNSTPVDDWYWIDALHMAMPVFTRLGAIHGNAAYFDKMYALYDDTRTRRGLYDPVAGLWYRDERYLPPLTTPNGQPVFWSRGNGWVFAAHAKVLEYLPASNPHRTEYLDTFRAMAAALKDIQRGDGFWNVSLADTLDWPGPETSGTAFFTFGLAWGINRGYLDAATYLPVVTLAWNGLTQIAVQSNGLIGYVQSMAAEPSHGQPVTADNTTDFGVGAFLLAGSEVYKLAGGAPPPAPDDAPHNLARGCLVTPSANEAGYDAAHAVDNRLWTRWAARGYPQWIELDLGAIRSINGTELAPYLGRAYRYEVDVKVDAGFPWVPIVDRRTSTVGGFAVVDSFAAVEGRFVRFTVSSAHDYAGDDIGILEFKVYGDRMTRPPGAGIVLEQNYPNPFALSTTIEFDLTEASRVRVTVVDVAGRRVATLLDAPRGPGHHSLTWNGTDDTGTPVASGTYFYRLSSGTSLHSRKLLILR